MGFLNLFKSAIGKDVNTVLEQTLCNERLAYTDVYGDRPERNDAAWKDLFSFSDREIVDAVWKGAGRTMERIGEVYHYGNDMSAAEAKALGDLLYTLHGTEMKVPYLRSAYSRGMDELYSAVQSITRHGAFMCWPECEKRLLHGLYDAYEKREYPLDANLIARLQGCGVPISEMSNLYGARAGDKELRGEGGGTLCEVIRELGVGALGSRAFDTRLLEINKNMIRYIRASHLTQADCDRAVQGGVDLCDIPVAFRTKELIEKAKAINPYFKEQWIPER
ncbi:hypothetical protein [Ellagibacter isourolithinifaciens]|uniref:hypothetical protein n=1 Tax=Ellagibacter isourolithinifaciens TaxID=2137581 RepID=UPI0023EFF95C|nr:hypothetical protein [Ellagibacter isourolithinifaciens]MDD5925510.1 hypothetical protein [Ellagibacter isourolithinifaciens]